MISVAMAAVWVSIISPASIAVAAPSVEVRVSPTGYFHRGYAEVNVTYRCSWPDGSYGSLTEVYSTLRQRAGNVRQVSHTRLDRDEFWCDGRPHTVTQYYSPESGRYRGGLATLYLDVRLCLGDEAGGEKCVRREYDASLRLRGFAPVQRFS